MSWIEITDYRAGTGWDAETPGPRRAHESCRQLESGQILLFRRPPFELPQENCDYLIGQRQSDSRLHKNISYRPAQQRLRGFTAPRDVEDRVRAILQAYSSQVVRFLSRFLSPYAGKILVDYASYRPVEEAERKLPLHKRNDLLHIDAFPSRPTRGGRILRVFTNLHPTRSRVWMTASSFPEVAQRYARRAGLNDVLRSESAFELRRLLRAARLPVAERSRYDTFMLRFHNFLKEDPDFQGQGGSTRLDFPPMSTWLVFTDGVPHAVQSGQFALEQTFIVPPEALVSPQDAPIRVLEQMCERKLA